MLFVLLLILLLPLKSSSFHTGLDGVVMPIKVVGAFAVIYAVWDLIVNGQLPPYFGTRQARLFLTFMFVVYISAIRGSGLSALVVTDVLMLFFVLVSVINSVKRLHAVLVTEIVSIALASLYSLQDWVTHRGWETGYRPGGVVDSNHFPIAAVSGISLAWYLSQRQKYGWQRWFFWVCLLIDVAATLTGGSRGGLLGLTATAVMILARSRKRIRNLVLFSVLLLGFNIAYPRSPLQRLLHPDRSDEYSENAHRASWDAGIRMLREHPISGIGLGRFKSQMNDYAPAWYTDPPTMAHNAFISVGAETGLPGLFLYLGTIIATYFSLERTYRMKSAPKLVSLAAAAFQAALVGAAISISFIPAEYHEHLWFAMFMSMCLPRIAKRFRKRHKKMISASDADESTLPELVPA